MERPNGGQAIVLGIILILTGVGYILFEIIPRWFLQLDVAHYGWPVFVIVPGLVLIGVGGTTQDVSGLCVPGAVVTMTGMVLMFQNIFDLFATWSYTWTLVVPGGVGIGMWLQGLAIDSPGLRAAGARTLGSGFILFLLTAVFFEGVVHVSGRDFGFFGRVLFPVLIIVVGITVMVRRTMPTTR
jgi:hypothetical protein